MRDNFGKSRLRLFLRRIQKIPRLLVASSDGNLYVYNLDMVENGDCPLFMQHRWARGNCRNNRKRALCSSMNNFVVFDFSDHEDSTVWIRRKRKRRRIRITIRSYQTQVRISIRMKCKKTYGVESSIFIFIGFSSLRRVLKFAFFFSSSSTRWNRNFSVYNRLTQISVAEHGRIFHFFFFLSNLSPKWNLFTSYLFYEIT